VARFVASTVAGYSGGGRSSASRMSLAINSAAFPILPDRPVTVDLERHAQIRVPDAVAHDLQVDPLSKLVTSGVRLDPNQCKSRGPSDRPLATATAAGGSGVCPSIRQGHWPQR
jgi:hypothetical protein